MRTPADVKADARAIIDCIDAVPAVVEEFCRVSGLSQTRLGYLAIGNPTIVRRLRDRGKSQTDTVKKVLTFIENWEGTNAQ